MNEQLQQALLMILNQTVDAVKAGTTFLMAQLPDVIQQLLIWKAVESGIWFGLGVLTTGLAVYGWVKVRKFWLGDSIDMCAMLVITSLILSTAGLCTLFHNLTWLQILVAPKIYLIEYAASLVKKG